VKVYSHLPNGINVLDSKWVLDRLFGSDNENENENKNENPLLATCKTGCFSGLKGFHEFARSVKLLAEPGSDGDSSCHGEHTASGETQPQQKRSNQHKLNERIRNLPGIAESLFPTTPSSVAVNIASTIIDRLPLDVLNWWVVKDAGANGAGGVWVVGSENAAAFGEQSHSPIIPTHRYVAQQCVWPLILYDGRKCHVWVYVMITWDGRAFVHRWAFLHVANNKFTIDGNNNNVDNKGNDNDEKSFAFDGCIHITNCCANSHDGTKFAGEILAGFGESGYITLGGEEEHESDVRNPKQPVVPLAEFFPSVQATVSAVVQKTFKLGLLDGGQKNNGFEYCGMDFMLS